MNVKVEKLEKNVVKLEIEVDAEQFEEGMKKAFIKNTKRFSVPGFRKGKAPRKIVERYYGEEILYEDAINFTCPDAYDKAVSENSLEPVDKPEIDVKQVGSGENLIFTATVTTKPEVVLGEYKGIEVEKVIPVVSDEEIRMELDRAAERNARMITIDERGIQKNDIANIDFEGFIDDEPFEGGKGEKYNLHIGSGQFVDNFEEQLEGMMPGTGKEVNVVFPENYQKAELAGKPARFRVFLHDIKVRELPEVDDEFAKDTTEFDTLEEYKADIRKKLEENAENRSKHAMEEKLTGKIAEKAEMEIPKVMIEKQTDNLVYDFGMRLQYQGIELEKYLQMMGIEPDAFRERFAVQAEGDVRRQLALEKIGQIEEITPTQEEIDAEILKMASEYKQTEEELRKHLKDDDLEYIKDHLKNRKIIDFLAENAKIAMVEKETPAIVEESDGEPGESGAEAEEAGTEDEAKELKKTAKKKQKKADDAG